MLGQLTPTTLTIKDVLAVPNEPITRVLFPEASVVSMLAPMAEGQSIEAAVIGYEGMVSISVALGADRGPYNLICQLSDGAQEMSADEFRRLLPECPRLREVLQLFALTVINQIARSSACNRLHAINQRLARWLLLMHDRAPSDNLQLTQDFLSQMLGAHRPSVSLAAKALQEAGLIRYRWGRITLLDRAGLEEVVCEDYEQTVREYERLLGS